MKTEKRVLTLAAVGLASVSVYASALNVYAQDNSTDVTIISEESTDSIVTYVQTSEQTVINGWNSQDGKWYYYINGVMQKNAWIKYNNQYYYMGEDGAMLTDTWIGNYYVDSKGVWLTNYRPAQWVQTGGRWWYRNADGSYPKSSWKQIDNQWYYFDAYGYMVTGWQKIGGSWYYFEFNGAMQTGKKVIKGQTYYLDANGKMRTGWSLEGTDESSQEPYWYYYNAAGQMLTGWQKIGGYWYYLQKEDGCMCLGKWTIDGREYYFESDGKMHTGWLKEINRWGDTGEACVDWLYYDNNGAMHTGWLALNGKRYHFSQSGYLACSYPDRGETIIIRLIDSEDYWYGFDQTGAMVTGWQYFYNTNNNMGHWMYFDKNTGKSKSGWIKENGKSYYIDPGSYYMVQNEARYLDGKIYDFDANGVAKERY